MTNLTFSESGRLFKLHSDWLDAKFGNDWGLALRLHAELVEWGCTGWNLDSWDHKSESIPHREKRLAERKF